MFWNLTAMSASSPVRVKREVLLAKTLKRSNRNYLQQRMTVLYPQAFGRALELGDRMQKGYKRIWSSGSLGLGLYLLWLIMHLIVSAWYFAMDLMNSLESYLISSGFLKHYKDLDISKVKYMAVVLDSEEARDTRNVLELLRCV